jgi:hypothetical protein
MCWLAADGLHSALKGREIAIFGTTRLEYAAVRMHVIFMLN